MLYPVSFRLEVYSEETLKDAQSFMYMVEYLTEIIFL